MKNKNDCYDLELLKKEIRKLKIPKEYFNFNLEAINTHDISMFMSIRKDSAKTTQALIIGLVLKKLYNYETEYFRIDRDQTTATNCDNIYDVIVKFGYIQKIFGDKWNGITYKQQKKRFYLCQKDEEGNILVMDERPCCIIHSLEDHTKMKSVYNNVNGNWFVVDEIFDTNRRTDNQIIELSNQISTVTRERPEARVVMLGNNLNKYSFWFEEFGIEKEIDNLNFGGVIDHTTSLGTTVFVTLLDVSASKKENVLKRKIRFFGFDTPKMAAFNGLQAFAGNNWKHLDSDELLQPEFLITNRIYIFHRGRWIQLSYYNNHCQEYVFLHYASKPKYEDNYILCQYPDSNNKQMYYGFGELARSDKLRNVLKRIKDLRYSNMWIYSSNSVGDLVSDYLQSVR